LPRQEPRRPRALRASKRLLKQASSTRSRRPSRWKGKEFGEQVYAGTTILFFTVGNAIKAVPWLLLVRPSHNVWIVMAICLLAIPAGVWGVLCPRTRTLLDAFGMSQRGQKWTSVHSI